MFHRDLAPAAGAARPLRPTYGFLLVYAATCYIGSLALLLGPDWVREWYVYLSGAAIDPLSSGDVLTVLALLHFGPALLLVGWLVADRVARSPPARPEGSGQFNVRPDGWFILGLFVASLVYLSIRIASSGVLTHFIDGWLNYDGLISRRDQVIAHLHFFEFVLVYSIVPLLAGAIVAGRVASDSERRSKVLAIGATLLGVVLINLVLFQKRPLLVSLLLIVFVTLLYPPSRHQIRVAAQSNVTQLKRWGALVAAAMYLVYLVLLMIPVLRDDDAQAGGQAGRLVVSAGFDTGPLGLTTAGTYLLEGGRMRSVVDHSGGAAVRVEAAGALQGISYDTGVPAASGTEWRLDARLRSAAGTAEVMLLLGQDRTNASSGTFELTGAWRPVSLSWRSLRAASAVTFAARSTRRATFDIDDVRLLQLSGAQATPATGARTRLGRAFVRTSQTTPALPSRPSGEVGGVRFPAYRDLKARERSRGLAFYALLGPFTRTAGPAVAYPTIYPDRHPFNRLDLGLDVLGFGSAPDDNATSFRTIFPTAATGVNSVPFQFTLFSQGGLLVAIIGSLVLGALWRLLWWGADHFLKDPLITALAASLLVVFGVQIAGDSARNAVLSSYGILWPLLLLIVAAFIAWFHGLRRSTSPVQRSIPLESSP